MTLHLGEALIPGLTREQAEEIFDACEVVGVDQRAVRTTDLPGFIVPGTVADELERRRMTKGKE